MSSPIDKLLNWYFTKNSLPYWVILLIDCAIVMVSGVLSYWIFNNAATLYANTLLVINTLLIFVVLSIPGFRIFHTYSGFMRYSSFVDLMRVAYCNGLTFALAWLAEYGMDLLPDDLFAHFNTTTTLVVFIIATLLMWGLRIFVKTLYDVAFSNTRAMRILIYGAMSGGVGLAKYFRSQRPRKYVVKGFITHYEKAKHQEIMGEKVYTMSDDIADAIRKNDIEAVMVSPLRVKNFRDNQELQDIIIGAGAKIFMMQSAVEMDQDQNQLDENSNIDYTQMQLREVSVEELLPVRSDSEVPDQAVHSEDAEEQREETPENPVRKNLCPRIAKKRMNSGARVRACR